MRDLDELQKHECRQQELLESIQRETYRFEEEQGRKHATVGLMLATLAYLSGHGSEREEGQVLAFDFTPCLMFFAKQVRKPVEEFTKDEKEQAVLIARFMKWLTASLTDPFESEFIRAQIETDANPESATQP